jgi:hypothetical protein
MSLTYNAILLFRPLLQHWVITCSLLFSRRGETNNDNGVKHAYLRDVVSDFPIYEKQEGRIRYRIYIWKRRNEVVDGYWLISASLASWLYAVLLNQRWNFYRCQRG